ncbi:MAG TPA: hypothetical protein VKR82_07495 [Candidatus Acidoferrales bacterium]|nr:hypothetical protein [Candidatus Acidoferrales bacterium]
MLIRARLAALLLFPILFAFPITAQEFSPVNLPADTYFFAYSHGAGHSAAANSASAISKGWDDPEFAQFRIQWLEYLLRHANAQPNGLAIKPTAENAAQIMAVLESPMILGISGSSDFFATIQSSSTPGDDFLKRNGVFFILDASGKTAQFDQLWSQIDASIPPVVTRSKSEFSGVSIQHYKGPNQTTDTARVGNYFVWSTKRSVIEDLITRLHSGSNPTETIAKNPDFKSCQADSGTGTLLEVFFRIPDLSKIPVPPNPQINTSAVLKGFHLDAFHAICGSMAYTPEGGRARGAVLGDTAAGGLFSIFGSNKSQFDLLKLAPPSAYSVTVGTYDLSALYRVSRSAIVSALAPEQQSSVAMVEMAGAAQLGMPIPDALALFTGEYASISLDANVSGVPSLFAISISDPQPILTLIHKLAAQRIASEKQENGITYLTFASPAPSGGPAPADSSFYLGIGPHVILASSKAQYIREAAERLGSSGALSLADNADVMRLRAGLPHDVMSISITDYSRFLSAIMTGVLENSAPQTSSKTSAEDAQFLESLKKFPWSAVFKTSRWSVGVMWKDSNGIHFESRSQAQ